jgi:hypothetical protein
VAEVEARCKKIAEAGDEPLVVVIAADRYLAWCAVNNVGPNSPISLSWYAQYRFDEGDCYEFVSGVDIPLMTAELDALAERISAETFGERAEEAIDLAQRLAEQMVRTAGRGIPADGWIRITHVEAPTPAGDHFDAVSLGIDADRSFPSDEFELICAHATITCLTGGSFAAERYQRREIGYIIWKISLQDIEALTSSAAVSFVLAHREAIPDSVDPSRAFDAPTDLEPLS